MGQMGTAKSDPQCGNPISREFSVLMYIYVPVIIYVTVETA
jgi:hypothetical protein